MNNNYTHIVYFGLKFNKIPYNSFYKIILPLNRKQNHYNINSMNYYKQINKSEIIKITTKIESKIFFTLLYVLNIINNYVSFLFILILFLYFFLMVTYNKRKLAYLGFLFSFIFYYIVIVIQKLFIFLNIKIMRNCLFNIKKFLLQENNILREKYNIEIRMGVNLSYIEILLLYNINHNFILPISEKYNNPNESKHFKIDIESNELVILN